MTIILGEQTLDQIPEILEWLNNHNLNSLSNRYTRYKKHIDNFFETEDPASTEGRIRFDHLTSSYRECMDIVIIYNAFKEEQSEGFRNRLAKIVTGQDLPTADLGGTSRDYLFELMTAARFLGAGYSLNFDHPTDVVAKRNGNLVYVECKRLSSEKRLEENIKKAGEQLTRETNKNNKKNQSLIFVDISSCLDIPKIEVADAVQAKALTQHAVDKFIDRNARKINLLNDRFLDTSLGTCFVTLTPIWTSDLILYNSSNIHVAASEKLSDANFSLLKEVFEGIPDSLQNYIK